MLKVQRGFFHAFDIALRSKEHKKVQEFPVCVMEVEQRIQSICNVLGTQTFSLINQEKRYI